MSTLDPFLCSSIRIEPSDLLESEIKIEPNTLEFDYENEIKIEENVITYEAYDVDDHNYAFLCKIEHSYAKRYEQNLHDIGDIKELVKNKKNTNVSVDLSFEKEAEEEIVTDNDNILRIIDDNEFADGQKAVRLNSDPNCVEIIESDNPVNIDLPLKSPQPVPCVPVINLTSSGGDSEPITASENKFVGKVGVREQTKGINVRKWDAYKTFKCTKCHYCTAYEALLKNHVKMHASEKVFGCTHCEYKTIYKRILNQHMMSHTPTYECSACIFSTTCKWTLNEHTKTHIKYEWKLNEHMKTRIKHKVLICVYCEYKTSSTLNLNEHMRIHNMEKRYHCTECTYTAKLKHHLIKHLELHASVMPYVCKICLYRTKDEESLLLHAEIHETSLNCPICGFKTDKTFVMENHMVKHVGKKSHKCNECDFVTWQYVEFSLHKQSHLNTVQCEVYNEKTSEEAFKMHRKSHTVKCDECDLVAVNNAALRVHIRNSHTIKTAQT